MSTRQDESLKDLYKINSGDRTWYITMNLTQPPFDDIHVRKAANLIMDKEGLRRAWGGEPKGVIAQPHRPRRDVRRRARRLQAVRHRG